MNPRLALLDETPFERIAAAFNEAFADYYLRMGRRAEIWLRNRMIKNAVDPACSVGAFEGDALVGFSLTGIDVWQGAPAAFDAATGIAPAYRGQGLARRMFDFALPRLRERGVERFLLEVLQVNEPAIKAYRGAGFQVTREFDCFEWEFGAAAPADGVEGATGARSGTAGEAASIRPIPKDRAGELAAHLEWVPSWENSLASIRRIPDDVLAFGAFEGETLVGTIVYYPVLNWVMNLVVARDRRRRGIGGRLLAHLRANLPPGATSARAVNVLHDDAGTIAFLEGAGFRKFTAQFEMELVLRS